MLVHIDTTGEARIFSCEERLVEFFSQKHGYEFDKDGNIEEVAQRSCDLIEQHQERKLGDSIYEVNPGEGQVVVFAPREEWEFIQETLYLDMESSHIDLPIREDIKTALNNLEYG